jgi:catechol 2,3-dioxygenase-like lactoylglutathione lyase family enzyme
MCVLIFVQMRIVVYYLLEDTMRPSLYGVLETCIYVSDLDRTKTFYTEVLGIEVHSELEGRHAFFRIGDSMLMAFVADESRKGKTLPPHGAEGEIHLALRIGRGDLGAWKKRLEERGIAIESEYAWGDRGVSLYFRDPDGNLVELVNAEIWGIGGKTWGY